MTAREFFDLEDENMRAVAIDDEGTLEWVNNQKDCELMLECLKNTDFEIKRLNKEDFLKKESKHCGNCCWFYAEDTYGWEDAPISLQR